jgi:hypothetical protein
MMPSIAKGMLALSLLLGLSLAVPRDAGAWLPDCSAVCSCASSCPNPCQINNVKMTCGQYGTCRAKCRAPSPLEALLARVGIALPAGADDDGAGCGDAAETASEEAAPAASLDDEAAAMSLPAEEAGEDASAARRR